MDTYWQSETGGIVLAGYAGYSKMKPAHVNESFLGISLEIVKTSPQETSGSLTISKPWPGMAKTILNNHQFFIDNYFHQQQGLFTTGDAAYFKQDESFYRILGRTDDVINVSGHRLSSTEIENVICKNENFVEAAVVPKTDLITG